MSSAKSISSVNNIFVFQVLVTLRYLGKWFFSLSAETFVGFQDLAFVLQWRMPQRPYANGLTISSSQLKTCWILKGFCFTIAAFPNVIGDIDGTLIPIIAPEDNESDFVCRKGFHAINVQAVADDSLRYDFFMVYSWW